MRTAALASLLCLACGLARALEPGKKISVKNDGDSVEVSIVKDPSPAPKAPERLILFSTLTVAQLVPLYISSFHEEEKTAIADQLARTTPLSEEDLRGLLNLYTRDGAVIRPQVESSLRRLTPAAQPLSPFFMALLRDEDPFLAMFGLLGALQLRSPEALPVIRALAEPRFSGPEPTMSTPPAETNRWQVHYQALQALALWEGRKALPLLEDRSKQVPALGGLIAMLFWEDALPRIIAWSESSRADDLARGLAAWRAPVPDEKLRATGPLLLQLTLDSGKKKETRHQAALKLGRVCDDPCAQRLLESRDKSKDEDTRALLAAALFASRSPRALPLLERYAKEDPHALSRAAAMLQLREMLPRAHYEELLRWAAKNDADAENRAEAARQLAEPAR